MEYVATTFDGQNYRFPETALPIVETAMREKGPVRIAGATVSGASISHIDRLGAGRYGPENTSQIDWEAAGRLLDAHRGTDEEQRARIDAVKAQIRQTLAKAAPSEMEAKKAAYLEASRNPELRRAHTDAAQHRLDTGYWQQAVTSNGDWTDNPQIPPD